MRFIKKHKIITIVLIFLSVYIYMNFTRIVEPNPLVDKGSEHYVNDLYASDGRIYSDYLDEHEKKIYKMLLNHTKKYDNRFKLYYKDYGCTDLDDLQQKLYNVYYAILIDHPELMNYAGITWYCESFETSEYMNVGLYLAFSNKYKEYIGQLSIQRIIYDIKLATTGMSDQEKVKYVYDWMGKHARYDYPFMTFSKNQSIYNVFMKGNAVCAGFAKASQVIFQNIGIESYTITGNTSGPHMWNIVKVDGKYYYYDSTVAVCRKEGSKGFYDGLNQSFFDSYQPDHASWYSGIDIEKTGRLNKKL